MDWNKLHESIKQRNEKNADSNAKKIMGDHFDFWANFYKNNGDKMERLMECLIADMRWNDKSLTKDDEILVRLGYEMMLSVMSSSATERQAEKEEKEMRESVAKPIIKNY